MGVVREWSSSQGGDECCDGWDKIGGTGDAETIRDSWDSNERQVAGSALCEFRFEDVVEHGYTNDLADSTDDNGQGDRCPNDIVRTDDREDDLTGK